MKTLSPQVKRIARKFYRAIGTPLALRLERAAETEDWVTIASCKVDPRAYTSSQEYFLDASAASLLRKCADLDTPLDRKAAAISNWWAGEKSCYRANERLYPYLEGETHPEADEAIANHLRGIRDLVGAILGRCPAMDHLSPRHGPGATFSDKSKTATVAHKMQQNASFTLSACWFLPDWFGTAWGREAVQRGVGPVEVRGNRFSTAPKDATKDRAIALEPSLNIFYQLGLGAQLRSRLKKIGIDLDISQEDHRRIACEASISGSYATLDLSNASDTVCFNLVKLLLPPDWFDLFNDLRSPFTRMTMEDGVDHWVRLEKFSSMGNGFTFELETLLFYAVAQYAILASDGFNTERLPTRVFGDDILCDSRGAENVTALLRFLGFALNTDKSFIGGAFKESCGGDFWGGRPVRPYFLKESPDEPQQLIAFANGIRRLGQDLFGGTGPLAGVWFSIQDQLPSSVRSCRGPSRLGDLVLHDDEVKWSWTSGRKDRVWAYVPVRHHRVSLDLFDQGTIHACGLYGVTVSDGFLTPRNGVAGYGFKKAWVNRNDWLPVALVRGPHEQSVTVTHLGPSGPRYDSQTVVLRCALPRE